MADDELLAPVRTREAVRAAKQGRDDEARGLLRKALLADPSYEPAWLWLAWLVVDDGHRKYCLEQAVEANPESQAHARLRRLRKVTSAPPPEVEDFADPPPPPEPTPERSVWRRHALRAGIAAVAVAVVAALVVLAVRVTADEPAPVHVAVVAGLSGPGAERGQAVLRGTRFHVDQINGNGGVAGHPVRLLVHDDEDDPEAARRVAEEIVDDGRAALVVGHTVSRTAIAAGPVYAAAGIAAITPTATADAITEDNRWFFRTTFTNRYQGAFVAGYLNSVEKARTASVIHTDTDYGRTLADGFRQAFAGVGRVRHTVSIGDAAEPGLGARIDKAVATVARDGSAGPVVLAMHEDAAERTLTALRDKGVRGTVVGGDALSNDSFVAKLRDSPQEKKKAGSLTGDLYLSSPLMADSLSGEALRWADSFRDVNGSLPSWQAMAAQTSIDVAVEALKRSGVSTDNPGRQDREAVRRSLEAMNGPERGVKCLHGLMYFDASRSLPQPVTMGVVRGGKVASAPIQLMPSDTAKDLDAATEIAADRSVRVAGQVLVRQQIVTTGFNFNEVSALDTEAETFEADFFLWFRYRGSDDATAVDFVNAAGSDVTLGPAVRSSERDGVKYRLYRVSGTFKASLDFHHFPFDRQYLTIALQNRKHSASHVVYVGDRKVLEQDQAEALRSGSDVNSSIDRLSGWKSTSLDLYKATVGSTAALGDPAVTEETPGIYYGQYVAQVTIERDLGSFLLKNMLPLVLLALVTYASLFFAREKRYIGSRISMGITAILSAAVLLTAVTGSLPDVEYTVAIEWGYYAFIFLAGTCVLAALLSGRLAAQNNLVGWRKLNIAFRIYYPLFCLAIVLAYVMAFG
ncbi:ABC transporter substrate-binding protein [Streptomyces anatolicus]|uniref:ABC transporter substrate-binding protein n=1 Tax=Streptomyces anatolicus TaxID=2675858 RepID=UPI001CA596D9|nr:ABC transporter substrate-binding protein [Streptomyces anatolicus]